MSSNQDEYWMARALALAERGRGFASPNPMVGACVVKGNRLISDGFHQRFGGPHAELEAIRKTPHRTKGASLYVSLEPCSSFGKTPPCTQAIINAGIRRVVIGAIDPNPNHAGRAIQILKRNGIKVRAGVLAEEASKQNEAFFKWIRRGIPFVTLKMAESLDGKIATRTGRSRWISGRPARLWVHRLRSDSDGVLVGKNTVFLDHPRLTVRAGIGAHQPWRIVLDRRGELSASERIFHQPGPVVLVCGERFLKRALRKFEKTPVTFLTVHQRRGRLDLRELLGRLGRLGLTSLLIEGGGETAWHFLEAGLVDKIDWIIAPKLIGGRTAKTSVEGEGILNPNRAWRVQNIQIQPLGADFLFEGYLN